MPVLWPLWYPAIFFKLLLAACLVVDVLASFRKFIDPGISPPSLILALGQNRPPYTLDESVMDPIKSCAPTKASLCAVQNTLRQVTQARTLACPELDAGGERRAAALEVLKKGNFSLEEEFGSTGFDVFIFTPDGEVVADPLRPDLVGENFGGTNYSGPAQQGDWLLGYVSWVTKWGGGWIAHQDIRLEGGDPIKVATYVESCPGSGDRLAVSFNSESIAEFPDCSTESNSVCARYNVNVVFGRALVDLLTVEDPRTMTDLWQKISFSDEYRVQNFTSTLRQLTWAGFPEGSTPSLPNTMGTQVASGELPDCNGYNATGCFVEEDIAAEQFESLGYSGWSGNFFGKFSLMQHAGFVGGVVWNNTPYALSSVIRHYPQDVLDGPLCTTCFANVSLICSLVNAQSLISHARVDLTLPGYSWRSVTYEPWLGASHSEAEDGEKIWPEGFYIVAFNVNSTCIADGHNPSNVGKTALEIFGNDEAHEAFLVAASMNARWMPYEDQGERRIAYINNLRMDGTINYVMVSVSRTMADWDKYGDCDASASEECSNWRAQVALGFVASEALACLDEDCLLELLDSNRVSGGRRLIGSDFPVHVYDSDFGCWSIATAGGLLCPPTLGREAINRIQAKLGSDDFTTLSVTPEDGLPRVAFIHYIEWRAVGSSSKKAFHLISFAAKDTVEPMCTHASDCPEHSVCSSETGRCQCESGYTANQSLVDSTCGGMLPTKMNCVYVAGQDCTSSSLTGNLDFSSCQDCRGGYFCVQGVATMCPDGQYCLVGTSEPLPCPTGSMGNDTGLSECYACPPGEFSALVGGESCFECSPGSYSGLWGQTSCDLCGVGHYSDGGQTECRQCPDGTYTSGAGAKSISECRFCRDGLYYSDGSCQTCSVGFVSTDPGDTSCHLSPYIQAVVPSCAAFLLIVWVLYRLTVKSFRARSKALQKLADEASDKVLQNAKAMIEEFGHPMVLVPALIFLNLTWEQLAGLYEGNRDAHRLVFVDTMSRCQDMRAEGCKFVMVSHQQFSNTNCPSDAQLRTFISGLREVLIRSQWDPLKTYVWIDTLSMPNQAKQEVGKLVESSIYLYSKCCDIFLAVCHSATNEAHKETLNIHTYKDDPRARLQVLFFCCARGPDSVFIYDEQGLIMAPSDFFIEMTAIFQVERSNCHEGHQKGCSCEAPDMILPLLGLYLDNAGSDRASRRNSSLPGLEFFNHFVRPQKEHIFPAKYHYQVIPDGDGESVLQERELFGDLLHRADLLIRATSTLDHETKGEVVHADRSHDLFEKASHLAQL